MGKQASTASSVSNRDRMVATSGVWKVTGMRLGRASGPESELATFLRWRPTGATAVTQHRAGSQNRDPGQVQAASKTKRHSEPTRPDPKGTGETASEHPCAARLGCEGPGVIHFPAPKIDFLGVFWAQATA
jgi:hypothetical protein